MVGNSLQELVQSFHPGLHKLLREAVDHALHHELLWQWLGTKRDGGGEVGKRRSRAESVNQVFLGRKAGQEAASWLISTYRDEVGWLAVLQLHPQPVKVLVAPSHTVLRQVKLYPCCLKKRKKKTKKTHKHICCITVPKLFTKSPILTLNFTITAK